MKIDEEKDVLIIGAGPAGLSAGLELVRKGIKVLIIDKKKIIGKPLKCGELTRSFIFEILDIKNSEKFIRRKYYLPPTDVVINRFEFENFLAEEIKKKGGKIVTQTVADEFLRRGKEVIIGVLNKGNRYYIKTKILILSEGVEAYLSRKIPFDVFLRPKDFASCYGGIVDNIKVPNPNRIYIIRDRRLYPGYFWVFPHSYNSANIGLGVLGTDGKSAKKLFKTLVSEIEWLKQGKIQEEIVGCISVSKPVEKPYADNVLLTGGAARFVNSVSGEGIYQAIFSGKKAAEVAYTALMEKEYSENLLKAYRDNIREIYPELIEGFLKKERLIGAI